MMKKIFSIIGKTILMSFCVGLMLAGVGLGIVALNSAGIIHLDILQMVDSSDKGAQIKDWCIDELSEAADIAPVKVEGISYEEYAYQQLDEVTQEVYDQIYDCIINFNEAVAVSTKDSELIADAYEAVLADHGDLFYINGYYVNTYKAGDEVVSLEFAPQYTMDEKQKDVYLQTVEAVSDEWLNGISTDANDYDKAKYVFETLIKNVDYDTQSKDNQNILSVFINKSTVCQGYADAAWYLLDKLGVESTIITGVANNEPHAWNLVYLNNSYYFMDVTWGNSKYMDADASMQKRINYAYLAMTSEELCRTHSIGNKFKVPECQSLSDNYFVREGVFFDAFEPDMIGSKLSSSYEAGDEYYEIKFRNEADYLQASEYFFNEQHLTDYCNVKTVSCILDDDSYVITIQWP